MDLIVYHNQTCENEKAGFCFLAVLYLLNNTQTLFLLGRPLLFSFISLYYPPQQIPLPSSAVPKIKLSTAPFTLGGRTPAEHQGNTEAVGILVRN